MNKYTVRGVVTGVGKRSHVIRAKDTGAAWARYARAYLGMERVRLEIKLEDRP